MKRIGVFTSGGDAPGMNACVRAIVRTAVFNGIEVMGIYHGYTGMIANEIQPLTTSSVSNIIQRGGTILKSSRSKEFMTPEGRAKAYQNVKEHGIDGLVAIGGNGTFTGALLFFEEYGIPTIGCPGTIDNDLYGTDYTIGFDTAVNTALDAIDKIRDTAASHDRVFFIEVMGRHSPYIAVHSGIAGGAEFVIVPGQMTPVAELVSALDKGWGRQKSSSIVLVAEEGVEGRATLIANDIREQLKDKGGIDIRVTTLGHTQRGGRPSAFDRILSSRLGMAAVEGLMEGRKCVMAGVLNDEIVYTPFKDTITREKNPHPDLIKMVNILST